MNNVDFGKTAMDYGRYRAGFPPALFQRLHDQFGIGVAGQRLLDLGTGTGTLARGFAKQRAIVIGLDKAVPLMTEAQRLDAEAGVSITYREGVAEDTGLPASSFEVVTAGQCWHWFDRPKAAAEVWRLLVAGGWLVIAHFDWLPLPSNMVEAMETLVVQHNPAWHFGGTTGLHPQWLPDVSMAGFKDLETFSFDVDVPYSHEGWRGRIRASSGVAASLTPEQVQQFDAEHAAILAERFPEEPLLVPHRVWALVARKPQ